MKVSPLLTVTSLDFSFNAGAETTFMLTAAYTRFTFNVTVWIPAFEVSKPEISILDKSTLILSMFRLSSILQRSVITSAFNVAATFVSPSSIS